MDAVKKIAKHEETETAVERVYEQVKAMAISFELRPGGRLNELAIARKIGVSRTPLREALNRLTADGFLTFSPKQGFFRKPLSVKEITDLYELREQIERGVVRLAVQRASDEALDKIDTFLTSSCDATGKSNDEIVKLDESFHEQLAALTCNNEIMRSLINLNERIRFIRWINMDGRRNQTQAEHRAIIKALRNHDASEAETLISRHIVMRHDQIVMMVKDALARIYITAEDSGIV